MRIKVWLREWPFFLALALLMGTGLVNQFSAGGETLFWRQALWMGGGLLILFLLGSLDYRKLFTLQRLLGIYLVFLGLLLFMAFQHQRWIYFGGFSLQPSEFAKPLIVALLAALFSENRKEEVSASLLGVSVVLVLIPSVMVAVTDLDQAFLLLVIGATVIMFAGIPKRLCIGLLVLGTLCVLVIGPLVWQHLKPYQRARLEAFLRPGKAHKRWSYQTRQALIALGSGGLTGQGFKQGLSSKLHYLPAKHTDLAFAVWAEEWGFAGSMVVLSLYALLIGWILKIAYSAKDMLGRFLAFGCAAVFFWEVFLNLGGVVHLLPAASLPLPFLSYGGSSIFVNMIMLGFAVSVMKRRFSFL